MSHPRTTAIQTAVNKHETKGAWLFVKPEGTDALLGNTVSVKATFGLARTIADIAEAYRKYYVLENGAALGFSDKDLETLRDQVAKKAKGGKNGAPPTLPVEYQIAKYLVKSGQTHLWQHKTAEGAVIFSPVQSAGATVLGAREYLRAKAMRELAQKSGGSAIKPLPKFDPANYANLPAIQFLPSRIDFRNAQVSPGPAAMSMRSVTMALRSAVLELEAMNLKLRAAIESGDSIKEQTSLENYVGFIKDINGDKGRKDKTDSLTLQTSSLGAFFQSIIKRMENHADLKVRLAAVIDDVQRSDGHSASITTTMTAKTHAILDQQKKTKVARAMAAKMTRGSKTQSRNTKTKTQSTAPLRQPKADPEAIHYQSDGLRKMFTHNGFDLLSAEIFRRIEQTQGDKITDPGLLRRKIEQALDTIVPDFTRTKLAEGTSQIAPDRYCSRETTVMICLRQLGASAELIDQLISQMVGGSFTIAGVLWPSDGVTTLDGCRAAVRNLLSRTAGYGKRPTANRTSASKVDQPYRSPVFDIVDSKRNADRNAALKKAGLPTTATMSGLPAAGAANLAYGTGYAAGVAAGAAAERVQSQRAAAAAAAAAARAAPTTWAPQAPVWQNPPSFGGDFAAGVQAGIEITRTVSERARAEAAAAQQSAFAANVAAQAARADAANARRESERVKSVAAEAVAAAADAVRKSRTASGRPLSASGRATAAVGGFHPGGATTFSTQAFGTAGFGTPGAGFQTGNFQSPPQTSFGTAF